MDITLHYTNARRLEEPLRIFSCPPRMRRRTRKTLLLFGWSEGSTTQPVMIKILEYL